MERIGVRQLRQDASRWLRRVKAGESFEVTDHGQPVARLVPVPETTGIEALIASGRARPPAGRLSDLGPPLPLKPGRPTPSEVLEELRRDER